MIGLRRALLGSMAAAAALGAGSVAWPRGLRALLGRNQAQPSRAPGLGSAASEQGPNKDRSAGGQGPSKDRSASGQRPSKDRLARAPAPRIVALAEDRIGPADDLAG